MLNPRINTLPHNTPHYLLVTFADQLLARRLPVSGQLALRAVCRRVAITVRSQSGRETRLNLYQLFVLAQRGVQIYKVDLRGDQDGFIRMHNQLAYVHQGTRHLTFNARRVESFYDHQPDYKTNFVRWMLLQRHMFPNLMSLVLKGVRMRDDVDLRPFSLKQLFLSEVYAPIVHDPAYQLHQRVQAECLRALSLVRSRHTLSMPTAFTGLKWLDLSEYQHWPAQGDLVWLTPLGQTLQTLKVQRCNGLRALDGLQKFRRLKSIDVRHNFNEGWFHLNQHTELTACINHLMQCRATHERLTHIQMQGCDYLTSTVDELPLQTLIELDLVFPPDPNHQAGQVGWNLVIRVLDLLQQT